MRGGRPIGRLPDHRIGAAAAGDAAVCPGCLQELVLGFDIAHERHEEQAPVGIYPWPRPAAGSKGRPKGMPRRMIRRTSEPMELSRGYMRRMWAWRGHWRPPVSLTGCPFSSFRLPSVSRSSNRKSLSFCGSWAERLSSAGARSIGVPLRQRPIRLAASSLPLLGRPTAMERVGPSPAPRNRGRPAPAAATLGTSRRASKRGTCGRAAGHRRLAGPDTDSPVRTRRGRSAACPASRPPHGCGPSRHRCAQHPVRVCRSRARRAG